MRNIILLAIWVSTAIYGFSQDSLKIFLINQPVIDVHLHITKGYDNNESYKDLHEDINEAKRIWISQELSDYNIVLAIGGGNQQFAKFYAEKDERFWTGLIFPCRSLAEQDGPCVKEFYSEDELRTLYLSGKFKSMGESFYNYYGIPPTDERLAPYWKIADDFSLPIGIHADAGPPKERVNEQENPHYNPAYANPELLRPILQQYPNLKIYLMHYGGAFSSQAIALMQDYPQIYCDISAVSLFMPKQIWEPNLKQLYAAGLGDRLMFGSDYFGMIDDHLKVIMRIDWLTDSQKKDILYNNASRFLGLSDYEINQHHQLVKE